MPTLTLNHTTMNNKLIAVSTPDGMVLRAKNPYLFLLLGTNKYTNYYRFEKTVKSYKADFDCKEGQEFDEDSVELVWQVLDIVDSCWIECDNEEVAIAYKKYGLKIRQAYKLKTKPKEEQDWRVARSKCCNAKVSVIPASMGDPELYVCHSCKTYDASCNWVNIYQEVSKGNFKRVIFD